MRIITGDECGLLKEVIPELCRPLTPSNAGAIHAGKARPSATTIQAAAASYSNAYNNATVNSHHHQQQAIQRLEPNPEIQSRDNGVVSLTFLPPHSNSNGSTTFNFAALRMNGVVETWTGHRQQTTATTEGSNDDGGEVNVTPALYTKTGGLVAGILPTQETADTEQDGDNNDENNGTQNNNNCNTDNGSASKGWYTKQPIKPIGMVSTQQAGNPILATCDSIGTISLINPNKFSEGGVVATYNAFDIDPSNGTKNKLTYTKGQFANTNIATSFAISSSSSSSTTGDDGGQYRLAVGGRERGVRIVDLESGKLLWKAKNLPPDPQTLLQQPMWTTAMQFLHTPTSASNTPAHDLLATGTAYKQVQIYDVRTSSPTRRPVLYTPEHLLTHRVTSLGQLPNGNTLAVGDTTGDVHLHDMRKMHTGKQYAAKRRNAKEEIGLGRLVGPGGSVRSLYMHPTLPYLACVGLDRKLWTWDVSKKKMMDCVYLRQRLNCLLVCEDESWFGNENDGEGDGGDETHADDDDAEGIVGSKRERDLEDDEVEDYVDSDDENQGDDAMSKKKENEDNVSSDETASDSEEEEDGSDSEDESTSEDDEPIPATSNRKKRRKG